MKAISDMSWALSALEIIACLVSFIYYNKLRPTYWRWLPFYLLFIVCLESVSRYLSNTQHYSLQLSMYKYIGFPVQFLYFYFVFYKDSYFEKSRKWVLAGTVIYLAAVIMEAVFLSSKYYWFHSFSYSVGNIALLVMLLAFFLRFVQEKELLDFSQNLMFWFCLGLLLYYLGTFPFWALRNVLIMKYRSIFETYLYAFFILNYCMYLLFTIGIIRCKLK